MRKFVSIVLSVIMVLAMSAVLIPAASAAGESAAIGSVKYAGLAEAIAAVKDGETIKITADYTTTEPIVFAPESPISFKIDGQGKKITANYIDGEANVGFLKIANATVTISNLNVEFNNNKAKNGTMGAAPLAIDDKGVVTLVNCNFVSLYGDCLNVNNGGKLTIKSGSYKIDAASIAANCPENNLICANDECTLVIDGGKFERIGDSSNKRALIRQDRGPADITINGGDFKCTIGRLFYLNNKYTPEEGSNKIRKFTINGGTFEFGDDDTSKTYNPVFNFNKSGGIDVVVNGGTFKTTNAQLIPDLTQITNAPVSMIINGGVFTAPDADIATVKSLVPQGTEIKEEAGTVTVGNPAPVTPAPATGDNNVIIFAAVAAVALVLSIGAVTVSRKEN